MGLSLYVFFLANDDKNPSTATQAEVDCYLTHNHALPRFKPTPLTATKPTLRHFNCKQTQFTSILKPSIDHRTSEQPPPNHCVSSLSFHRSMSSPSYPRRLSEPRRQGVAASGREREYVCVWARERGECVGSAGGSRRERERKK